MDAFNLSCHNRTLGGVNSHMSILVNYLAMLICDLSPAHMWPMDYGSLAMERGFKEYDFIIAGAGSAGSVLANRLSENPNWTILVLEAGGDPPIESAIPGLVSTLAKTKYDWQYYIESPSRYSQGSWPRGKMLGGSSSMNGLIYVRGSEDDYNNWETLGNPLWGWKDVLPYFKKSELNQNSEIADAFDGYYHSKSGPMSVELFYNNETIDFDIVKAAQEMGFKFIQDINADDHIGFTFSQGTIKDGVRESAATAFLVPVKDRPNLHVVKNAQVLNLVIDGNGVVSGVRINLGQQELKVSAKKEVILSAGAINSPQILMVSGIGPASHLQEMGIPVLRDLQVGKNLQDHPTVPILIKYDSPSVSNDLVQDFVQYLVNRTGSFATVGTFQTMGFVNVQNRSAKYPDFQFIHTSNQKGQKDAISGNFRFWGYKDEIVGVVASEIQHSNIITVLLTCLQQKSRGEILLRSSDATEKPRIFANYLSDYADIVAFVKAIRLYLKLLEMEAYKSHKAELLLIPIRECNTKKINSDEYWECYCRYMVTTLFHPVGTARMGSYSDRGAVVDSRLKVKGTKGLRVIDASVMPVIPRGNINAPITMIAEKGADFIKQDWS